MDLITFSCYLMENYQELETLFTFLILSVRTLKWVYVARVRHVHFLALWGLMCFYIYYGELVSRVWKSLWCNGYQCTLWRYTWIQIQSLPFIDSFSSYKVGIITAPPPPPPRLVRTKWVVCVFAYVCVYKYVVCVYARLEQCLGGSKLSNVSHCSASSVQKFIYVCFSGWLQHVRS